MLAIFESNNIFYEYMTYENFIPKKMAIELKYNEG